MKVIHNRFLPIKGFAAINLFGIIFARKGITISKEMLNHEYIHTLQQRELLWIGFYLIYIIEWLYLIIRFKSAFRAYRNIHFEREAYIHQTDETYASTRQNYAWLYL